MEKTIVRTSDEAIQIREFEVFGGAEGRYEYTYWPGRTHMSNGDPGYPAEGEIECIEADAWVESVFDADGNEVPVSVLTEQEVKHVKDILFQELKEEANES